MAGTLLLADDSITIQKVVELTFAGSELNVVAVSSGRELLQRLDEVNPDIVLCDVVMPEMDGYEICQHIKSEPSTLHIPVVLLTGTFEPFDRERALAAGCDAIVTKPFEAKELVRIVRELLETGRTNPEALGADEGASGIPEGVPSLDFTTTGFDRMVPPPVEEPSQPENGLEVTSIGAEGGAGEDGQVDSGPVDAEADLPWGEEAPETSGVPADDETFPSPPRAARQEVGAFTSGPAWAGEESEPQGLSNEASPWDTAPPADAASPWDTSPPPDHRPEIFGDEPGASEQSGYAPEETVPADRTEEPHREEPTPVWGERPPGVPPAPQSVDYKEVELDEDDGLSGPDSEEEPVAVSSGPNEDSPSASLVSLPPPVASPATPLEQIPPAPAEETASAAQEEQAARVKEETGDQEESADTEVQQVVSLNDLPVAAAQFRDLTDDEVERIARRVVELAQPLMERVTWEVIPDMAEMLVQKRIRELEAAIDEEN